MNSVVLTHPTEVASVAKQILDMTAGRKVFALTGQMGAGKTTLIKGFCEVLGVTDQPSSPTFSVINEYHTSGKGKVYHFDCYRLKSPLEALDLGCEEYFYSGNYCFIEWPDLIGELVPADAVKVNLDVRNGTRIISIH